MAINEFYTLVTTTGKKLEVQAKATNTPVNLARMAVGDGGGAAYNPIGTETQLRGEKWRGNLNALLPHPKNPAWLIAECILPDQEGGWWVREVGLLTETDALYAIAKYPETFKPILDSGAGKMLYVRMIFEVTNATAVTLQVDPSVVLTTREELLTGLDAKLGKTQTASAAKKLAAPRNLCLTGGATAAAQAFDGSADVALTVSDLDMNHATTGLLPVARGGTGIGAVPVDAFLMGGADGARLIPRTPAQVSIDIGVPTTIANALHQVGLGGTDAYGGISNLDDPTLPAGLYYSRLGKEEGNWSGFGFLLHKIYDTAGFQLANVYGSGVLRFRERFNNQWQEPITLANLESPCFTGTPRADTPAEGDDSDRLATTRFVANMAKQRRAVVLTVEQAVNADALTAPDTLYKWINMGPGWSNFPNLHNAGYLHTYLLGSSTIVQELTIIETGSKPILYHRFGSQHWQPWRVVSTFSHTYQLPNWNAGDVYLDGIGWQRWVNTPAYTGYRSLNCGQVAYFFADQAPSGWLKANGAEVSRTTYVGLYSLIGNRYGGSATNFCLPDMRGEFIRGADDGRGVDPGRSLGSNQPDAFQGHWHQSWIAAISYGTRAHIGEGDASDLTPTRQAHPDRIREAIPDGVNGTPRIANETRPRNVALMAYIKI